MVGFNVVQMGDAQRRVARFFQSSGRTRALLIKAEEIFTVPQTKPRILILGGNGERVRPQCYTLFLLKGVIDSLEGIFQH